MNTGRYRQNHDGELNNEEFLLTSVLRGHGIGIVLFPKLASTPVCLRSCFESLKQKTISSPHPPLVKVVAAALCRPLVHSLSQLPLWLPFVKNQTGFRNLRCSLYCELSKRYWESNSRLKIGCLHPDHMGINSACLI